jgi:formylglycine-generating enzyme required for sulfatase activity
VDAASLPPAHAPARPEAEASSLVDWVDIPAGSFLMGCDRGEGFAADGEGPVRRITLDAFAIGATPVTNAQFDLFVDATGYLTDAERAGSSFVFQPPRAERHRPTHADGLVGRGVGSLMAGPGGGLS